MKYKAIISYTEIVTREGVMLQRGMNYRIKPNYSIILMSVRKNAPYNDKWHDDLGLLEYEGHDQPKKGKLNSKLIDQPMKYPSGKLTENGKFFEAAKQFMDSQGKPEIVQVYEKITQGIWCDHSRYELIEAKIIHDGHRKVFRFFLRPSNTQESKNIILKETRIIPTTVKIEVWNRDKGQCVICGAKENLHFDHDIPYSKGGSSITPKNVRILCAKHNLKKSDKIMSFIPWATSVVSLMFDKTG